MQESMGKLAQASYPQKKKNRTAFECAVEKEWFLLKELKSEQT